MSDELKDLDAAPEETEELEPQEEKDIVGGATVVKAVSDPAFQVCQPGHSCPPPPPPPPPSSFW